MTVVADPARPPTPAPIPPPRREQRRRRRAAAVGTRPVDRLNRVMLALLGLVLLVSGTAGLLAGAGTVSWRSPGALYRDLAADAAAHPRVWATGAALFGLVLVVIGLWFAWKQVTPRAEGGRLSTVALARTPRGRTTLEPAALARAAAHDMRQVDGVSRARVRVVSLHPVPDLIAWVELRIDVDPTAIRTALEQPLERLAHALDAPGIDCDLRLGFGTQQAPRVQ